jgi:hypothetical protein
VSCVGRAGFPERPGAAARGAHRNGDGPGAVSARPEQRGRGPHLSGAEAEAESGAERTLGRQGDQRRDDKGEDGWSAAHLRH